MSSTNRSNARDEHIADYYVTPISDIELFLKSFQKVVPLNWNNSIIVGSQSREWFFEKYMPEWAFVHHIRIGFTDKKDKDGYTIFDKDGVPKRGSTDSIEYMHAVWHKSNLKPDYTKLVLI